MYPWWVFWAGMGENIISFRLEIIIFAAVKYQFYLLHGRAFVVCRSACKYMQPERHINYSLFIILVERIYAGQSLLNLLEKFYYEFFYDANYLYITQNLLQVALSTDRKMISFTVRSTFLLIFFSISLSIFNAGSLISVIFIHLSVTMCQLNFLFCTARDGLVFRITFFILVIIYAG